MRSVVQLAVISLLVFLVLGGTLPAQTTTAGSLHGQVTDPSGAVVTKATITAKDASGKATSGVSNSKGSYEIKTLAPGAYTLHVTAKGFSPETQQVTIAPGAAQSLDISLKIAVEQQSVNVEDDAATVNTDASSNASAVVLKGKDLDALSDDPDDLQSDLQALAGPAAGPNGGEIYIDGFSNGQLPPKSAIREIRVNQNPFSAQFDHMGFGRVEVFTKPGSDAYHGQFQFMGNSSAFNSLNPYLKMQTQNPDVPAYHTLMYSGNVSGPISKKSSFFFNAERRSMDEVSVINALIPCTDANHSPTCSMPFSGAVPTPRIRTEIAPRFDYQLTPNNTLMVRYEYESSSDKNNGVGNFSLPAMARNGEDYEHNFRITDTQVLNSSTINETRLQFIKSHSESSPLTPGITYQVADMFTMGGNSSGFSTGDQQHIELQNYTSKVYGKHFIKFGGRLRRNSQENNEGGWYGSAEYRDMPSYYSNLWDQFRFTAGNARTSVSQTDGSLYAEDDWRVRSKITLSYGLRLEAQNNVSNNVNFAPRIGLAWGLGKGSSPKTVLRAGFGMFYDRFSQGNVLRINTSNSPNPQVDYVVRNDQSSTVLPDITTYLQQHSSGTGRVIYAKDLSDLKMPYVNQTAVTIERQLPRAGTVSVSYVGSRGVHQLLTQNLDALQPLPFSGPFHYQYVSAGTFKQDQLMVNSRISVGKYVSLFSWYVYGHAGSNTGSGNPSDPKAWDPLNLSADWGRSGFDVRHRGMIGGSISLPMGFRLNPLVMIQRGSPYNVTTGTDDNHDNIKNDRPWFSGNCPNGDYATNKDCYSLTATPYGKVPINYLTGPGMIMTHLRISKTIGFGSKGERAQSSGGPDSAGPRGGGRGGHGGRGGPGGMMGGMMGGMGGGARQKYNLTFTASARNVLNTFNEGRPSGVLSSGNFGKATSMGGFGGRGSANRRIDFGVSFSF